MASIEELEAKKQALKLEREIAWMEREKSVMSKLKLLSNNWVRIPLGILGVWVLVYLLMGAMGH